MNSHILSPHALSSGQVVRTLDGVMFVRTHTEFDPLEYRI